MKIKKFDKKLTINKETIAHLSFSESTVVLGGGNDNQLRSLAEDPFTGCPGCPTFTCAPSICSGLYCC